MPPPRGLLPRRNPLGRTHQKPPIARGRRGRILALRPSHATSVIAVPRPTRPQRVIRKIFDSQAFGYSAESDLEPEDRLIANPFYQFA